MIILALVALAAVWCFYKHDSSPLPVASTVDTIIITPADTIMKKPASKRRHKKSKKATPRSSQPRLLHRSIDEDLSESD